VNGVPKRQALSLIASFLAALIWGFFVSFNAVFSDAFGTSAYVGLMFYVLLSYALLGLVFGIAWPQKGWRWTFWLTWPALLALVAYTFREPQRAGWHLVVIALAMIGAGLGALAGSGIRRQRPDARPPHPG